MANDAPWYKTILNYFDSPRLRYLPGPIELTWRKTLDAMFRWGEGGSYEIEVSQFAGIVKAPDVATAIEHARILNDAGCGSWIFPADGAPAPRKIRVYSSFVESEMEKVVRERDRKRPGPAPIPRSFHAGSAEAPRNTHAGSAEAPRIEESRVEERREDQRTTSPPPPPSEEPPPSASRLPKKPPEYGPAEKLARAAKAKCGGGLDKWREFIGPLRRDGNSDEKIAKAIREQGYSGLAPWDFAKLVNGKLSPNGKVPHHDTGPAPPPLWVPPKVENAATTEEATAIMAKACAEIAEKNRIRKGEAKS